MTQLNELVQLGQSLNFKISRNNYENISYERGFYESEGNKSLFLILYLKNKECRHFTVGKGIKKKHERIY